MITEFSTGEWKATFSTYPPTPFSSNNSFAQSYMNFCFANPSKKESALKGPRVLLPKVKRLILVRKTMNLYFYVRGCVALACLRKRVLLPWFVRIASHPAYLLWARKGDSLGIREVTNSLRSQPSMELVEPIIWDEKVYSNVVLFTFAVSHESLEFNSSIYVSYHSMNYFSATNCRPFDSYSRGDPRFKLCRSKSVSVLTACFPFIFSLFLWLWPSERATLFTRSL